jgi:hypothetical protein
LEKTYEEFYKIKVNHNKTPEQKELVKKKRNIYDIANYYWGKIGKACYADFPEKLKQSGAFALSSPESSTPRSAVPTPRSDMQSTPRYGDSLHARPANEDYDEADYYHSGDGRAGLDDLNESNGERTGDIVNYLIISINCWF